MKILSGQNLVNTIRQLADNIEQRLWIAVPYIGTYETVLQILGSSWLKNHKVSFKLITDVNELNSISASTISTLKKRGTIRSLIGLHAKIYIIDNHCIIGSANLTRTSFTKRYEAVTLLSPHESQNAINLFEEFWGKAKAINDIELQIQKKQKSINEDEGNSKRLVQLSKLHKAPIVKEDSLGKKYLSYSSIKQQFEDFTNKYQIAIGTRLWNNIPIYYEIDSFLNYLFEYAPGKPSHDYKYSQSNKINEKQQMNMLKGHIRDFKKYVKENEKGLEYYKKTTALFKKNLSKENYKTLSWDEIKIMLKRTNAGYSQPINISKIINPKNNELRLVRELLYNLINGSEQLEWRMYECDSKILGMGNSLMNETIHFYNPQKYPLVNLRSCSGLRYFGYDINEYRANKKKD